jgi:uncharacterized membrane protein
VNDKRPPAAAKVGSKQDWYPLRFVRARPWLSVSGAVSVLVVVALLLAGRKPALALLLGFDLGALLYLGTLLRLFNRATAEHMSRQASAQEPGRRATLFSAVGASVIVLVSLAIELHAGKNGGAVAILLAVASIVLAWLFMNTMFAQHYAHGYYGHFGKEHEGLDFPGTRQPDYWDFVYFAFVIGMCFQVSDVQIKSRLLRRTVLLHSVIGFFFNVFIIAISVNVAAGQA